MFALPLRTPPPIKVTPLLPNVYKNLFGTRQLMAYKLLYPPILLVLSL